MTRQKSTKTKQPRNNNRQAKGGETHQQADPAEIPLTTNQGLAVSDNQNSLRAGDRGPTLLEDFVLREKITHFDHERIPERIVHARGAGAHGYFQPYNSMKKVTKAAFLSDPAIKTPIFVRFSTVAGERGSADLARDVRGFAVKFYTSEGNFDLVGNNIPVFFIQDAVKFPDVIHPVKPEPDRGFPQAASAHDTFWDFISMMPESMHMIMWVMSDRAIPRSFRMMEGFGIHTFRLVNEAGESQFVKFHWRPKLGTSSVLWDEAVKINGADADFHRRDLWEAIAGGDFPEFELGLQIFDEEMADRFEFDVLDATKLIPVESEGAKAAIISAKIQGERDHQGHLHVTDMALRASPSVLFDAVVLLAGEEGDRNLAGDPNALTFLTDAKRHCKAVGFSGIKSLAKQAGVREESGIVDIGSKAGVNGFIDASRMGRFWEREGEQ